MRGAAGRRGFRRSPRQVRFVSRQLRLPAFRAGVDVVADQRRWRDRLPPWMSFSRVLFVVTFLVPMTIVVVYAAVLASDRYVSEARFTVRGISGNSIGGLATVFRAFGIGNVKDDAFAVLEYMESRDAVRDLSARLPLADMLNRPEADFWSGYGRIREDDTREALYDQYRRYVQVYYDTQTGITTLRVQSFRPEDSHAIARELLGLAEALVNRMNGRAQTDALTNAEMQQRASEERVIEAQTRLTEFRNRELLIDPGSSSNSAVQLVVNLTSELASLRVLIDQTRERSPLSPNLPQLQARADALRNQIELQRGDIVGSDSSLSGKIGAYERLALELEFANGTLEASTDAMEVARQEVRRQRIYIETIAFPSLADKSTEPRRLRLVASTFLFCIIAYGMSWLLVVGAREHSDFES